MSNRVWTRIVIGGKLPVNQVSVLRSRLEEGGFAPEHEELPSKGAFLRFIRACANGNLVVVGEPPGAVEHELIEFLKTVGLAFRIAQDGQWDVTPSLIQYLDPEHGEEYSLFAEGEPASRVSQLQAALVAGDSLEGVIAELRRFELPLPVLKIVPRREHTGKRGEGL